MLTNKNVYIASACCVINDGEKRADEITDGTAYDISQTLNKKGLYVGQPLRYTETGYDKVVQHHPKVYVEALFEKVVDKREGDDS